MKTTTIKVNLNPVSASRPRVTNWGVFYAKKYNTYRNELKEALNELDFNMYDKDALLDIEIEFHIEIAKSTPKYKKEQMHGKFHDRKPDVDNLDKAILDGMSGIVYYDDNRIVRLTSTKYFTKEDGYTLIKIKEIKQ